MPKKIGANLENSSLAWLDQLAAIEGAVTSSQQATLAVAGVAVLQELKAAYTKVINSEGDTNRYTAAQLAARFENIRDLVDGKTKKHLDEKYKKTLENAQKLGSKAGLDLDKLLKSRNALLKENAKPNTPAIRAAGKRLDAFWYKENSLFRDHVTALTQNAVAKGETWRSLEKQVKELLILNKEQGTERARSKAIRKKIGLSARAELIAKTEIASAYLHGQIAQYRKNGYEWARWSAAAERTCGYCISRDGVVFEMDDVENAIPAHPRCRCTLIPVAKPPKKAGSSGSGLRPNSPEARKFMDDDYWASSKEKKVNSWKDENKIGAKGVLRSNSELDDMLRRYLQTPTNAQAFLRPGTKAPEPIWSPSLEATAAAEVEAQAAEDRRIKEEQELIEKQLALNAIELEDAKQWASWHDAEAAGEEYKPPTQSEISKLKAQYKKWSKAQLAEELNRIIENGGQGVLRKKKVLPKDHPSYVDTTIFQEVTVTPDSPLGRSGKKHDLRKVMSVATSKATKAELIARIHDHNKQDANVQKLVKTVFGDSMAKARLAVIARSNQLNSGHLIKELDQLLYTRYVNKKPGEVKATVTYNDIKKLTRQYFNNDLAGSRKVDDDFHPDVYKKLNGLKGPQDGATINPFTGTEPGSGTMVAIDGVIPLETVNHEEVKKFVLENRELLSRDDVYLGSWISAKTGEPVVELSRLIPNEGRSIREHSKDPEKKFYGEVTQAELLGRLFDQEGIFVLDSFDYIPTGGADELKKTKPKLVRWDSPEQLEKFNAFNLGIKEHQSRSSARVGNRETTDDAYWMHGSQPYGYTEKEFDETKEAIFRYTGQQYTYIKAEQLAQAQKAGVKLTKTEEEYLKEAGKRLDAWNDAKPTKLTDNGLATDAKLIEDFINKSVKYEGKVYRGMDLDQSQLDEMLVRINEGKPTKTLSSFSSEKGQADNFWTTTGSKSVMFEMYNLYGAPVASLSANSQELEVLQPSGIRYRVQKVQKLPPSGSGDPTTLVTLFPYRQAAGPVTQEQFDEVHTTTTREYKKSDGGTTKTTIHKIDQERVYEQQGFNDRPEIVEDIDELMMREDLLATDDSGTPLIMFRGVGGANAEKYQAQWQGKGDEGHTHFVGKGIYGNGSYAAAAVGTEIEQLRSAYETADEYTKGKHTITASAFKADSKVWRPSNESAKPSETMAEDLYNDWEQEYVGIARKILEKEGDKNAEKLGDIWEAFEALGLDMDDGIRVMEKKQKEFDAQRWEAVMKWRREGIEEFDAWEESVHKEVEERYGTRVDDLGAAASLLGYDGYVGKPGSMQIGDAPTHQSVSAFWVILNRGSLVTIRGNAPDGDQVAKAQNERAFTIPIPVSVADLEAAGAKVFP